MNYTQITTDQTLKDACEILKTEKELAVDLEADSLHHFKEKVCLIQLASSRGAFIVDPLSITDFSPFKPVLEDSGIIKLFHGGDFDIRSMDRDFGLKVNNLFDSEIACKFLGIQQRSLAALLKKHFDINLNKQFQRTDWSKRPLSQEMIVYGLNDVLHLAELCDILKEKLRNTGRLTWAREEFEIQSRVRYENGEDLPLFLKFKGAGKMDRRTLAVLESLLQLRYVLAQKKDRPLFKVMGADALMRMAREKPQTMNQLQGTRALSPKQMPMLGKACLKAVSTGLKMPESELPVYPRKRSPRSSPKIPERIKHLKTMREKSSTRTGIEPGFLINNALISAIAHAGPAGPGELEKIPGLRNWQMEVLGEEIISTLARYA